MPEQTNDEIAAKWAKVLGKRILGGVSDDGTTTLWSEDMARVAIANAIDEAMSVVVQSFPREESKVSHERVAREIVLGLMGRAQEADLLGTHDTFETVYPGVVTILKKEYGTHSPNASASAGFWYDRARLSGVKLDKLEAQLKRIVVGWDTFVAHANLFVFDNGVHMEFCSWNDPEVQGCTCGLDQLEAAIKGIEEKTGG